HCLFVIVPANGSRNWPYTTLFRSFYGNDSTTFRNNIGIGGSLQLNGGREESNSWNLGISNPGFASTDPSNPNFLALASGSPAIKDRKSTRLNSSHVKSRMPSSA